MGGLDSFSTGMNPQMGQNTNFGHPMNGGYIQDMSQNNSGGGL
jgi:hypothetical protein